MSGRVYRRCGCRSDEGKLVGATCPLLTSDDKHGTWGFAVDLPSDGKRKTMRRGGFVTKRAASAELKKVIDRVQVSVTNDDKQTVAQWLEHVLAARKHDLAPKTIHQYGLYYRNDITPAIGHVKLEKLRHDHVAAMIMDFEEDGRGHTTLARIRDSLSSALTYAVKTRRLTHNAAEHVTTPAVDSVEREPWTAAETVRFLEVAHGAVPYQPQRLADLYDVIIGTGLRRGEILALRWEDVDLKGRVLRVKRSAAEVNGKLILGPPKSKGSAAGVGLSGRVVAALKRQQARQDRERLEWAGGYEDSGLVFARENGAMLRPKYVLGQFHAVTAAAGLRQVRLHDLRHLAATLMLMEKVPLELVSKFLRHANTQVGYKLYGHLTKEATIAASDSIGGALDAAAAEVANERALKGARRGATTLRPQRAS